MLLTILANLGLLILLFALTASFYNWIRQVPPSPEGQVIREGAREPGQFRSRLPLPFKRKTLIACYIAGLLFFSIDYVFFYAEPGMSYLVQYPWGTQKAVLEPGFATRWFGNKLPFKKFITVSFGDENTEGDTNEAPKQEIRFHDSVLAWVKMTGRFQLPSNPEQFRQMAVAYRSEENLVHSTLIPIMQEAMRNAGRMFSAQEYIGGKGGDFENSVLDQIRNGIFLLDITERRLYRGAENITTQNVRTVQQDQTIKVNVEVRQKNGIPLRKDADKHPLKKFGLLLVQANVQDVDPDPDFKGKLKEQRDAAAQVAIERQKARQEEERKKRIIAQGEAEKAGKRVELEMRQIERVIAAETKAKEAMQSQRRLVTEADTRKQVAEVAKEQKSIELATAKLEAQRIETLARAEAERRKKLMEADNALEKRLATYEKVMSQFAMAIQNKQIVPSVVINGGGGDGKTTSSLDLINLLTAKAAMDLGVAADDGKGKRSPTKRQ